MTLPREVIPGRFYMIQRNREFIAAYRDARTRWLGGAEVSFPVGTYWLRRFARVLLAG